jgi:hypothetical protein
VSTCCVDVLCRRAVRTVAYRDLHTTNSRRLWHRGLVVKVMLKVAVVLGVALALAAGLLPPLLDRGNLDNLALSAARAGSAVLDSTGSAGAAEAAARGSVAADPGVSLQGVRVVPGGSGGTVEVTVSEDVHTFMSGWPGVRSWLSGWFHLTSTESAASVGT